MISLEKKEPNDFKTMEILDREDTAITQPSNSSLRDMEIETSFKTNSKRNRKNCLKFCRRLTKYVLTFLKSDDFIQVLDFAFNTIESVLSVLGFIKYARTSLIQLQKEIHLNLWKTFKHDTGSANPKICLVTPDEWESMFSYEGFSKQLRKFTGDFKSIEQCFEFYSQVELEIFIRFFVKIQFLVNMIVVNTVIMREMYPLYEFQKLQQVLDDCMIMANVSHLYIHYNHSKGKFALECCGKCKICCSTILPKNFLEQLKNARNYMKEIKEVFSVLKSKPVEPENSGDERWIILYHFFSGWFYK